MLIRYAVMFVSQININSLAEGFNQNRNILDLDGDVYTAFQSCDQYTVFQKIVNLKRKERGDMLENVRNKILKTKEKSLVDNNPSLSKFLDYDYRKTIFQDIKASYRLVSIVLHRQSKMPTIPLRTLITKRRRQMQQKSQRRQRCT